MAEQRPKELLDQARDAILRDAIRLKDYSICTAPQQHELQLQTA